MNREFPYDVIEYKFHSMETTSDFIQLLNEVYRVFILKSVNEKNGNNLEIKPITLKRVKYYLSNLKKTSDVNVKPLYQISKIPKKNGGERLIHSPNSDLKVILKIIDIVLRSVYNPHPCAFAFIESKSIIDNAKIHTNKRYVYNIDLKDFFYSFDYNKIKMALYNTPFNLNTSKGREEIAYWISILTTYKIDERQTLPQGSPSSPVITNILCARLDKKLFNLSKEFSIEYSRYADDITFSSDKQIFHGKFISRLHKIIESEGLNINNSKVRLQNQGERQVVTGITVNKGTNVSKNYIKELRMYLYLIDRYGINKALTHYLNDKKIDTDNGTFSLSNLDHFQHVLKGKLNFLSMVKGKDDSVYKKLSQRYNEHFPNNFTSLFEEISHYSYFLHFNDVRELYYRKKRTNHFIVENSINNQAKISDFNFEEIGRLNSYTLNIINPVNENQDSKKMPTELDLNIKFIEQILNEPKIGQLERYNLLQSFSNYVNSIIKKTHFIEDNDITHNPKVIQDFLGQFTMENEPVKFLTHPMDIPFASYETLMERVNDKKYLEYWRQLAKIDSDLWWNKIYPFIFQKHLKAKQTVSDFAWGQYSIKIGWQYPDVLKNWCKENFDDQPEGLKKMPGQMKIPKELLPKTNNKPNGKSVKFFADFIDLFNSEIRFIDGEFKLLLQILTKENLPQHDVDLSNVADTLPKFYVNVSRVRKALKSIFHMIDDRPANKNVLISAEPSESYVTLKITHLNSVPSKFSDLKNGSSKGSIAPIVKELRNVCDFSIITNYVDSDLTERFDYLFSDMEENQVNVSTEPDKARGFTFVLKFLK